MEIIQKIAFRHKKVNDKRYVYEEPRIIQLRHQFLRRMRRNRRERRLVVYTNETWANSHDDITGGTKGDICKPTRKGNRLIILHEGGIYIYTFTLFILRVGANYDYNHNQL